MLAGRGSVASEVNCEHFSCAVTNHLHHRDDLAAWGGSEERAAAAWRRPDPLPAEADEYLPHARSAQPGDHLSFLRPRPDHESDLVRSQVPDTGGQSAAPARMRVARASRVVADPLVRVSLPIDPHSANPRAAEARQHDRSASRNSGGLRPRRVVNGRLVSRGTARTEPECEHARHDGAVELGPTVKPPSHLEYDARRM